MKLSSFTVFILSIWVIIIGNCHSAFAQSQHNIAFQSEVKGWINFKPEINLTANDILSNHLYLFSLGPNSNLIKTGTDYDEIGYAHHRYQMYHKGILVEHAVLYLHELNGKVIRANGFIPNIDVSDKEPIQSHQNAINAALAEVQATKYLWEVSGSDSLALALGVPGGTFYPQPELIYTDTDFKWNTEDYRLAYKLEVFTTIPHGSFWVYVDALNGDIIKDLSNLQHTDAEGTAETMFHGTQTINTDSTENGYRLREYDRASQGIETYNLQNGTNITQGIDFYDSDNYWDTTNAQWDEVATDVHWGMEKTYDYYFQNYGRDSYDGAGGKIPSFVHFDVPSSQTAFWNVYYAGFGDANGLPHVGLDVVAHEFTHGVIRNTPANLIYIDEGGALNEGYADIMGNSVQYAFQPDSFSWLLGETTGAVRNLANPNSFQDPDTYGGLNWYTGDQDNGGAHINSNVLGHWFYLLSDGGSGTNDIGNAYQVTGIGIEKAAAIAYRNLTTYLTPTSQYVDARQGMIQSAEDLYGVCSEEVIQTINAWYAVGVGDNIKDNDLIILEVKAPNECQLSGAEPITITLYNKGCMDIPAGDVQMVYFVKDPASTVLETFNLPNGLAGRSSIDLTFVGTADLSQPRDYEIFAKNLYAPDTDKSNDDSPTLLVQSRAPVEDVLFDFEGMASSLIDTFILTSEDNSQISISDEAGNNGGHGILMEGGWGFDYRFVESYPLWGGPEVDVFDYNRDFGTSACICINAGNLVSLNLQFDLKQLYSNFFAVKFDDQFGAAKDSMMRLQANNLRVTANGEELTRYQALTQSQDSFETHSLDLNNYLGNSLKLCFEGRTVWDKVQDFDSIGDRIFIDNITINSIVSDLEDDWDLAKEINVYPNPSQGIFNISFSENMNTQAEIKVLDLLGKTVLIELIQNPATKKIAQLDLSNQPKGIYLIQIIQGRELFSQTLIKD